MRLWPHATALVTRNGVRVGVWAGGPQPVVPVGSGTVAQAAPSGDADGAPDPVVALAGDENAGPGPTRVALHAAVASPSAHTKVMKRGPDMPQEY